MDHTIPPSPAPSICDRSPPSLSHSSHQDFASQHHCTSTSSELVRVSSQSASRYQTPERLDSSPHGSLSMAYTQPHQGLPLNYTSLAQPNESNAYDMPPSTSTSTPQQIYNLNTPDASPPTAPQELADGPSAAGVAAAQRATHGMKVLGVKAGRIEKSSPPRKRPASLSASPPTARKEKSTKTDRGDVGVLDQPLSVVTKDWDLPIVDIKAYVHRSEAERRHEVEQGKIPGKVKRAMNAFMLYRKAYQDRAKKWAQQSNHQVVSKICGTSWSLEPESVRSQFSDWAVIERDNHRKAHPEYKFTPSKPRKKGKDGFEDDSDMDDPGWEASGHRGAKFRSASRTPMIDPHAGPYGYSFAQTHVPDTQPYPPYQARSSQHMPSLAQQHASTAYDAEDYMGNVMQYRQVPPSHHHQLDSMAYAHATQPGLALAPGQQQHPVGHQPFDMGGPYHPQPSGMAPQPLGGLPPRAHAHGHPSASMGHKIDPSLMPRDGLPQYGMSNPVLATSSLGEGQWQPQLPVGGDASDLYAGPYLAEVEETYMQDNHLQYLQGDDESWKVDPVNNTEDWHPLDEA